MSTKPSFEKRIADPEEDLDDLDGEVSILSKQNPKPLLNLLSLCLLQMFFLNSTLLLPPLPQQQQLKRRSAGLVIIHG